MARYRKKPVVVEAIQFTEDNKHEALNWAKSIQENVTPNYENGIPILVIPTLEGDHICSLGDYIIRGIKGELYPCKPDIFKMTYEPVD